MQVRAEDVIDGGQIIAVVETGVPYKFLAIFATPDMGPPNQDTL